MTRITSWTLTLLLLALLAAPAAALPRTDAITGWDAFLADHPGSLVQWDETTGGARSVLLPAAETTRSRAVSRDEAEKIARAFLRENGALLGTNGAAAGLKLVKYRADGRSADLRFAQTLGGYVVEGAGVTVNLSGDRVLMATNSLDPKAVGIKRFAGASLTVEQAQAIALGDLAPKRLRGDVVTETIVSTRSGVAGIAHAIRIPSADPLGDFEYLVAADNGKILKVTDYMDHASATGKAYPTNPIRGKIETVKLNNLKAKNALVGQWAEVINDDEAGAQETDGTFDYADTDTHFDEVCAYYYFDTIHDYYKNTFGFSDLDRSFPVHVHYGDAYDNAFFSPWEGIIALGDGNRLNDLAREESVSWHEYTHAVTGEMCSMREGEAGAMNEAFSDYFPCSITDDPDIGEWAMAKMNKPYMRRVDNTAHYPEDIQNEVHRDSPIYSGALWDLRKELGAEITDKLAHFSRKYMPASRQKFVDGLKATLAADRELFRGLNEKAIRDAFKKHGIEAKDPQTAAEFRALLTPRALEGDAEAARAVKELENVE